MPYDYDRRAATAPVVVKKYPKYVQVDGITSADAEEIFGSEKVEEVYGQLRVTGLSMAQVRGLLRDRGGYRTKVAE